MKKTILYIGAAILVIGLGAVAYVLRPSAEASAPIQALPVQVEKSIPTATMSSNATAPGQDAPTPAAAQAVAPATATPTVTARQVIFQIVQEESEVRFSINEVLRGNPFTPVGRTNQVAGEIAVDFAQATGQLGVIQVNARTLKTDSNMRDRAIQNQILETGRYEFITFTPKEISDLPQSAQLGDEINVTITGDLTIRDITQEITFTGKVKLVTMDRMEGYAAATVLRSAYQLVIPQVPSVAGVDDDVLVEIEFVAVPK